MELYFQKCTRCTQSSEHIGRNPGGEEKQVSLTFFQTNFLNLIHLFQRFRNENPVIVIDFMQLNAAFAVKNSKELLCGGRHSVFARHVGAFLRKLTDAGAELVFFNSIYTQIEGIERWIDQAEMKYEKCSRLLELIHKKPMFDDLANSDEAKSVVHIVDKLTIHTLFTLAKQYGTMIKDNDVRRSMAAYAAEKNALAVMSGSADFLVFNGDYMIWSLQRLHFIGLTTMQFDKVALRKHLDLTKQQMRFLVGMIGNQIVPNEKYEGFHKSLDCGERHIIDVLAELVKTMASDVPNEDEIEAGAMLALNGQEHAITLFENVLNHYNQVWAEGYLHRFNKFHACFHFSLKNIGNHIWAEMNW